MTKNAQPQAGNVLFLILIAVALFAALSYAVTQSSRSGGDGVTKDKIKLEASSLIQYATMLENAISRLQVINRCTDLQIDFFMTGVTNAGFQHATEKTQCKVFHADGGAVPFQTVPEGVAATSAVDVWRFTGQQYHRHVGSGEPELTAMAVVTREACLAINDKLGIVNPSGEPPGDPHFAYSAGGYFNGGNSGASGGYAAVSYIDVAQLDAKRSGCGYDTNNFVYVFFHVLIAR